MTKRILGLDVGIKRTGVAISDALGLTAQPLTTIEGSAVAQFPQLTQIIVDNDVAIAVVGLPYLFSGESGERVAEVNKFCEQLKAYISDKHSRELQIEFVDERLSSKQAEFFVRDSKLKNKDKSRAIDRVAASILLETYLLSR